MALSVAVSKQASGLADCNCFSYDSERHRISLTIPKDWPKDVSTDTLLVFLSYNTESAIFHVPIVINHVKTNRISQTQGAVRNGGHNFYTRRIVANVWSDSPDF